MKVQLQLAHAVAHLDDASPMSSRITAGRDASICGLLAEHGSVSRRHAEMFIEAGQLYIRDLGSSNGTWVDGVAVGQQPVALGPGQTVYVGYMPLGVQWSGPSGGATVMAVDVPAELRALIEARKQQAASHQLSASAQMPAQLAAAAQGVATDHSGVPEQLNYRRQGANQNGVLLIALPGDAFSNGGAVAGAPAIIEGFVEFTALDDETVDSVSVELVEAHKKGPRGGHVWDRVLVRQGPWKTKRGDVLPMPFQLRVPSGTSVSGRDVQWEVRGYVDIAWAYDVDAISPITMRNKDIDLIRDGLGTIDYRVVDIASEPLGQKHRCVFQPPAQLQTNLGIKEIRVAAEYLGANMQVELQVDKSKHFVRDPKISFVVELARFRQASLAEVGQHFLANINQLMSD